MFQFELWGFCCQKRQISGSAPTCRGMNRKFCSMFNEVFGTQRTMEHWQWKFRNNPFWIGADQSCVNHREGMPVSQYAGYPVPFCSPAWKTPIDPCDFRAFHSGDTFTHPSVRRIGLGKTGLLARTTDPTSAPAFLDGVVPFGFGFNTATIKKAWRARYLGYQFTEKRSLAGNWILSRDVSQTDRDFFHEGFFRI